jgi:hypothetical protein
MNETTYNGYTNYATWKIMLEQCNNEYTYLALKEIIDTKDVYEISIALKDYVESDLFDGREFNSLESYAYDFLQDVNWIEIAEHMIEY